MLNRQCTFQVGFWLAVSKNCPFQQLQALVGAHQTVEVADRDVDNWLFNRARLRDNSENRRDFAAEVQLHR
jgi:hypothetical protein